MADDGWDDLFAKAAGKDKESPPEKRQRKTDFLAFLAGRMNVPGPESDTLCPPWARLGDHMSGRRHCKGWEGDQQHGAEPELCKNCGTSPLQHRLVVATEDDFITNSCGSRLIWPCHMFCSIRNLRCVGILVVMDGRHWAKTARADSLFSHNVSSLVIHVPGEAELLTAKCQTIMRAAESLRQEAKKQETMSKNNKLNMPSLFEEAVRLVIACDEVYYRLYYLQISRILPVERDDSLYLPHPAAYFHVPCLAGSGMGSDLEVKDFLDFVLSQQNKSPRKYHHEKLRDEIAARYGFDLFKVEPHLKHPDVLSFLHRNRAMETARLFCASRWNTTQVAHDQTMEALRTPVKDVGLSRHETAAPPILAEWRDSCRDRLCNLYAYATLSHGTPERIKEHLEKAEACGGIVEIGAGTGYLASLLQKAGINIVAWDLHPTGDDRNTANALNKYHGLTPEFCSVSKGGPSDLRRHSPKVKGTTPNVALLLCYPPPESSMAKDALAAYLQIGGRCLVHIGEFGGLTGTTDFEDLLVRFFTCADRFPCLSWGTDAAEVTIWMKNNDSEEQPRRSSSPSLLLPCSNCGKVEASKRCRLVRHVAYCGETCFQEHSPALTVHLAMNMILMQAESLNFFDNRHFVPIGLPVSNVHKSKTLSFTGKKPKLEPK